MKGLTLISRGPESLNLTDWEALLVDAGPLESHRLLQRRMSEVKRLATNENSTRKPSKGQYERSNEGLLTRKAEAKDFYQRAGDLCNLIAQNVGLGGPDGRALHKRLIDAWYERGHVRFRSGELNWDRYDNVSPDGLSLLASSKT